MTTSIKKSFNLFADLLIFIFELILFKIRKKNSPSSYKYMLRFFYLSGGISNDIINFFVSKRPKKNTKNKIGLLSKLKPDTIQKYQFDLKKNGYLVLENILSDDEVSTLIASLKEKKGYYLSDESGISEKQKLNIEKPKAVKFFYSSQDIINTKPFHKILFDPSLINFSQNYLNSYPVIDNISSWWSFPAEKPDKNAAQWWHFDLERPKWLKFFFFLTDCTKETGAHCFVRGSQKNNGIKWSLRKNGYSRLSDDEVNEKYEIEDIIQVVAKKGSLLIEDTRGLHKGSNLIKDYRFLLQLQYSSSAYGAKIENFKFPKLEKKEFIEVKEEFNHTYSLFH